MSSNKHLMTAQSQTPSRFVMPISAAAYGTGLGMAIDAVCTAPTSLIARDRYVAGVAVAQDAFPGPTAWSPPTC